MTVHANFSAVRRTKWYEYGVRFIFGGAITVATGLIAKKYGPVVGGLFLAFPAIFPASATLLEKHERQKKLRAGMTGTLRGRQAAALDARGAVLGALGLACFAIIAWKMLEHSNAALALVVAFVVWTATSVGLWRLWRPVHLAVRRKSH